MKTPTNAVALVPLAPCRQTNNGRPKTTEIERYTGGDRGGKESEWKRIMENAQSKAHSEKREECAFIISLCGISEKEREKREKEKERARTTKPNEMNPLQSKKKI